MFKPSIFKAYDIRGPYTTDFDLDFVAQLSQGFLQLLQQKLPGVSPIIAVGGDARLSTPLIKERLINQLSSSAQIWDLGLVTTPMTYFAGYHYPELTATIMVTASHNPKADNGFKMCIQGRSLTTSEIQELLRYVSAAAVSLKSARPTAIQLKDVSLDYINYYRQQFRNLQGRVLLDCGNGAAGVIARRLYSALGLDAQILLEQPDGNFPVHHPDPTVAENLVTIRARLGTGKYLLGLAFDGDADRVVVLDSRGREISPDYLLTMFADYHLQTKGRAKFVMDVKCSDKYFRYLRQQGAEVRMWKTGHSLTKSQIQADAAALGGELSGHIFFNDRTYNLDDGLYVGLRTIELLNQGVRFTDLQKRLPKTYATPELRIPCETASVVIKLLKKKYQRYQQSTLDGLRVSWSQGWFLVRASNTQPVVSVRVETNNRGRTQKLLKEILAVIKNSI